MAGTCVGLGLSTPTHYTEHMVAACSPTVMCAHDNGAHCASCPRCCCCCCRGRVYRARWAGLDVAVKVIQHDRSTLAAVEAEADLMLTLHHPNVVKAYHYCAFTCSESLHSEKSRSSRAWSHLGNRQASFSSSQSSGGSAGDRRRGLPAAVADSRQLTRTSTHTNSASNSGSGSGARVLLLRQQQAQLAPQGQQPADGLQRQDSSDVLITNLSLDAQAAQEAVTIASSIAAVSSVPTKGSTGTEPKVLPREASMSGECGGRKAKAETWLVSVCHLVSVKWPSPPPVQPPQSGAPACCLLHAT